MSALQPFESQKALRFSQPVGSSLSARLGNAGIPAAAFPYARPLQTAHKKRAAPFVPDAALSNEGEVQEG